jgi:hypothetical protein
MLCIPSWLLLYLKFVSNNESFIPDIRSKADGLLSSLLKYENILIVHMFIVHMFMKIFSITDH